MKNRGRERKPRKERERGNRSREIGMTERLERRRTREIAINRDKILSNEVVFNDKMC